MSQCKSEAWDKIPPPGRMTRCYLPDGHTEKHTDGCMSWCEEGDCRCGKPLKKMEYRPFADLLKPS